MTTTSHTFYLLRAKATSVGDGPYVGLASDGAHSLVPEFSRARRFASIDDAEEYAGNVAETFGAFEIEVRTSGVPAN